MRTIRIIGRVVRISVIAVVVLTLAAVLSFDPFNFGFSLFGNKLTIDKTANVVAEIKKISELTSACYYEEMVLQDKKFSKKNKAETKNNIIDLFGLGKEHDDVVADSTMTAEIVIIVHGKVRAGYDLSKMSSSDIAVSGDTLSVKLPQAEVFDVIVNPSDVDIFHSIGEWGDDEVSAILSTAKEKLERNAMDFGLIEKASVSGKEKLELMFKALGFEVVKIQ